MREMRRCTAGSFAAEGRSMNGYIERTYRKGMFRSYQKEILSRELCDIFMPVNFIERDTEETAIYRVAGYVPLAAAGPLSEEQALTLASSLIEGMIRAEQHCIFIGEYRICEEVLGVCPDSMNAALLYQPWRYDNREELLRELQRIMEGMERRAAGRGNSCLHRAVEIVSAGRSGLDIIGHRIEMLRQKSAEHPSDTENDCRSAADGNGERRALSGHRE